jgi:hypothetical protein
MAAAPFPNLSFFSISLRLCVHFFLLFLGGLGVLAVNFFRFDCS